MNFPTLHPVMRSIAFFAHDSSESTVIKRVKSFEACGARVRGFMFHRLRNGRAAAPHWENTDLGATVDRNYVARLSKLVQAVFRIGARRREFRRCDAFYARNVDMLGLALAGKWFSGSRAPLVYEVLDVQRVFTGTGVVSGVFRSLERFLLRRCDLLVVSSPMFVTRYFTPVQGYRGPWYLLENKIPGDRHPATNAEPRVRRDNGPPWIIGWFGTLRCLQSLKILSRLAEAFPDKIIVHVRGRPSEEDIPQAMLKAATNKANFLYFGPYRNPDDLAEIYGNVHFAWSIDLLDEGSNSDWLLPNRVYEGGLHDAVAIARAGTATSDMVERENLGVVLQTPLYEDLADFILQLTPEKYQALAESSRRAPRSLFIDDNDTRNLLQRFGCGPSECQAHASEPAEIASD